MKWESDFYCVCKNFKSSEVTGRGVFDLRKRFVEVDDIRHTIFSLVVQHHCEDQIKLSPDGNWQHVDPTVPNRNKQSPGVRKGTEPNLDTSQYPLRKKSHNSPSANSHAAKVKTSPILWLIKFYKKTLTWKAVSALEELYEVWWLCDGSVSFSVEEHSLLWLLAIVVWTPSGIEKSNFT